jgi:hypothetical protein
MVLAPEGELLWEAPRNLRTPWSWIMGLFLVTTRGDDRLSLGVQVAGRGFRGLEWAYEQPSPRKAEGRAS